MLAGFAAMAALGRATPLFLGVVLSGVGAVLGGALATATSLSAPRTAALVVMVALAATPTLPVLSFRLAGLRLPVLPTTAEDLRDDVDPIPRDSVLRQSAATDRFLAAALAGVSAVAVGCLTVLARQGGIAAPLLACVAGMVLALRSRVMAGTWQRLFVLAPAVYGGALLLATRLANAAPDTRVLVAAGGPLVLAWVALVAAHKLPGRRLLPYWGRAADLLESLTAVAVPVLVLAVLHAYSAARGWG
jgi:type VII secretion integral membrane protein EccD